MAFMIVLVEIKNKLIARGNELNWFRQSCIILTISFVDVYLCKQTLLVKKYFSFTETFWQLLLSETLSESFSVFSIGSCYCVQKIHLSFEDTCLVLTSCIIAAHSLHRKCIQEDQFNAGGLLTAGGSDDDDWLLFKRKQRALFYYPAVLFKKCIAVFKRSVGSEWLIELLIRNGL